MPDFSPFYLRFRFSLLKMLFKISFYNKKIFLYGSCQFIKTTVQFLSHITFDSSLHIAFLIYTIHSQHIS